MPNCSASGKGNRLKLDAGDPSYARSKHLVDRDHAYCWKQALIMDAVQEWGEASASGMAAGSWSGSGSGAH